MRWQNKVELDNIRLPTSLVELHVDGFMSIPVRYGLYGRARYTHPDVMISRHTLQRSAPASRVQP